MKKRTFIILGLLSFLMLNSCNEWLDVSPKTEIKSEDNFTTEQGYKDALTGVYLLLTDGTLYGRELTFGLTDVLAQYYTGIYQTSHVYYYPAQFDYTNEVSVGIINNIWGSMYNAIVNVNELIEQLESADQTMFTGRNYYLIKGEAYGLRAFMHFDLLRLFGPSYAVDPDAECIPYVANVSTKVTDLSTVSEIMELALEDLEIAEENLLADPVISENTDYDLADESYERARYYKFNYYAVQMLKARIYLYMEDYTNANIAAQEVIAQNTFTWTPESEITTSDADGRNYVMSQELVFSLYDNNLRSSYTSYFTGTDGLYMYDENYEGLFELNKAGYYGDYRYTYLNELLSDANIRVSTKLKQPSGSSGDYYNRIPLMRISEAYYIAAECALHDSNTSQAVEYLNDVRLQRNLPDDLNENLSIEETREEIYKEYAKEFMAEGQLYYFFKRLDYPYIPVPVISGAGTDYTYIQPNYIFPLPDDELDFGGRD